MKQFLGQTLCIVEWIKCNPAKQQQHQDLPDGWSGVGDLPLHTCDVHMVVLPGFGLRLQLDVRGRVADLHGWLGHQRGHRTVLEKIGTVLALQQLLFGQHRLLLALLLLQTGGPEAVAPWHPEQLPRHEERHTKQSQATWRHHQRQQAHRHIWTQKQRIEKLVIRFELWVQAKSLSISNVWSVSQFHPDLEWGCFPIRNNIMEMRQWVIWKLQVHKCGLLMNHLKRHGLNRNVCIERCKIVACKPIKRDIKNKLNAWTMLNEQGSKKKS